MSEWMRNPRRREVSPSTHWADLGAQALQMRRLPTPAESTLWQALRGRRLDGLKFRRQHAIGRFIVDFYCVRAALVVEVDGPIHATQTDADHERQEYLEAIGLTVLRFTNQDVLTNLDKVLAIIRGTAASILQPVAKSEGPA